VDQATGEQPVLELKGLCKSFGGLHAVRDRRRPLCSIDEAGRTVLACLAGVESYRTNRPVAVLPLTS
jgi:hypothetical protein